VNPSQSFQNVDPVTERLQTLGMRIRKSVADGYMLPSSEPIQSQFYQQPHHTSTHPTSYLNDYQQQHFSNIKRTPLPSHLQNQPPPLLYNGSTASSLAGWEDDINSYSRPLQTFQNDISNASTMKRRREDDEISYQSKVDTDTSKVREYDDYVSQYGPLSFKEDF
ncbi:hypothetical protein CANARDRAFT_29205, partial [[Candida] arabinofermentans NRRL YB-2248]